MIVYLALLIPILKLAAPPHTAGRTRSTSAASSCCRCWRACFSRRAASACWPSRCFFALADLGMRKPSLHRGYVVFAPVIQVLAFGYVALGTWCPSGSALGPGGVPDDHAVAVRARVGVQVEVRTSRLARASAGRGGTSTCGRTGRSSCVDSAPAGAAAVLQDEGVAGGTGVLRPVHLRGQILIDPPSRGWQIRPRCTLMRRPGDRSCGCGCRSGRSRKARSGTCGTCGAPCR